MTLSNKPTKETLEKWHNDLTNWKLGIFYFNKDDKRLLPPKKIKQLGWTVNFANPFSILTLLALIVLILVLSTFFNP